MSDPLLIYGATGFTGQLIAQAAIDGGMRPLLAGRDDVKLRACGQAFGLAHRVARLDDPRGLESSLDGVKVVLNAAGPFSATAGPLVNACLRRGVHYLDVTGEVAVLHQISQCHAEARSREVMLMPGVGFDVVPSDCLAIHVAARVPNPRSLFVGISGLTLFSRGSARTMIDGLVESPWVRRDGQIKRVPVGSLCRQFDFGAGARKSVVVSWGDVATAYFSTGIGNITLYFEATPAVRTHNRLLSAFGWAIPLTPWQAMLHAGLDLFPQGPSPEERQRRRAHIVVEVEDQAGHLVRSRLTTPEAYTLTARTSTAIAARVLDGDVEPGFQTPGRVFGADFILGFSDVRREDL